MVKIGWSKREKAPYEHKAPKRALELLLDALLRLGQQGQRFTTDEILPLQDPEDGTELPSYQVYLCLAWMRFVQLVDQHGRQGYSLLLPEQLKSLGEDRWNKLEQR